MPNLDHREVIFDLTTMKFDKLVDYFDKNLSQTRLCRGSNEVGKCSCSTSFVMETRWLLSLEPRNVPPSRLPCEGRKSTRSERNGLPGSATVFWISGIERLTEI